jgi:ribosomal protein L31E
MISEMQLPYHGSVHLKDESKLTIIRDYLEKNMSAEEVVLSESVNTAKTES